MGASLVKSISSHRCATPRPGEAVHPRGDRPPRQILGGQCCREGRCVKADGFPEQAAEWPNEFLMTEASPSITALPHSREWILNEEVVLVYKYL